ncbi:hypothetical protein JCM10212_000446 [Sporobolomyces blumeae]
MQPAAELGHMDRLTQTQNSIDDLVRIMSSTLSYLSRKSTFKPLNPNFPATQSIPNADPPDVFQANQKELVVDFVRKAKQLEYLIDALPSPPPPRAPRSTLSEEQPGSTEVDSSAGGGRAESNEVVDDRDLADLERELVETNNGYLDAIDQAAVLDPAQPLDGLERSPANHKDEPLDP